jgi:hypothetical protein
MTGDTAFDVRYVALGLASQAQARCTRSARAAAGAAQSVGRPLSSITGALIPTFVRRNVEGVVLDLDARGRSASASVSARARQVAETLGDRLGQEPAVQALVDAMVEHVQWQVVDAVLPVVLERLTAEPDQVRLLVQGQSRGMVEELTHAARSYAVDGDDAVERLVDAILHRRSRRHRAVVPRVASPAVEPELPSTS